MPAASGRLYFTAAECYQSGVTFLLSHEGIWLQARMNVNIKAGVKMLFWRVFGQCSILENEFDTASVISSSGELVLQGLL